MKRKQKLFMTVLSGILMCSVGLGVSYAIADTLNTVDESITLTENYTDETTGLTGVKVTTKKNTTQKFEYWNEIEYTKGEDTELVEFTMDPKTDSTREAEMLCLTFSDALDDSQAFSVIFALSDRHYSIKSTYTTVAFYDSFELGAFNYVYHAGKTGGTYGNSSLIGAGYTELGYMQTCSWNDDYYGLFCGTESRPLHSLQLVLDSENQILIYNTYNNGAVLADLDDPTFLNTYYSALEYNDTYSYLAERYTNEYVENLFSSGRIKMNISYGGMKADASIVLHSVGGEEILVKEDKTAPLIDVTPTTNGLKGVSYTLPEITLHDNFDTTATYMVTVLDPEGNSVRVENGKFLPEKAGVYEISLTATDNKGNTAKKDFSITIFDETPSVSWQPMTDTAWTKDSFITYETLTIPAMEARSAISRLPNNAMETYAVLKKGEETVYSEVVNNKDFEYRFEKSGEYMLSYVTTDAFGNEYVGNTYTLSVVDYPYMPTLEKLYIAIGETYVPDTVYCLYKGKELQTDVKVLDSRGQEVTLTDGGFVPTAPEKYTILYSCTVDGMTGQSEQLLESVYMVHNLVSYTKTITVTENYEFPRYSNLDGTGLYVKTIARDATFAWKNTIDLSKLSATDNLIRFYPQSEDGCEGAQYMLTLRDKYDSKNVITITIIPHDSLDWLAYIQLNYDGRPLARYSEHDGRVNDWPNYGCLVNFSCGRSKEADEFYLQCDYEERQFYINCYDSRYLLLDLDNGDQVGYGNEWSGFTSGEVYLDLTFTNCSAAGIIIDEIAGQSLAGISVDDQKVPNVYFSEPKCFINNEGVLPDALVGTKYPLLTATAYDDVFADCEVTFELYQDGSSINLWNDTGYFTPQSVGKYLYKITTSDKLGNKIVYEYEINAYNAIDEITIKLDTNPDMTIYAGSWFTMPNILVDGGSGLIEYAYTLELNGKTLTVEDCGDVFMPGAGDLIVKFTAQDYIGSNIASGYEEIVLEVKAPENPVISVNGLPNAVIVGQTIVLPDFSAIDYNYNENESGYYTYRCVKVNGSTIYSANSASAVGSLAYTVTGTGALSVQYCAGTNSKNLTTVNTYEIPIIELNTASDILYASNYDETCIETELETESTSSGMAFIVNGNKAITLASAAAASSLDLRFSGLAGKSAQEYMDIVLSDYYDERNDVILRIKAIDGTYYLFVNGDETNPIKLTGSMSSVSEFITLNYDNSNFFINDESGYNLTKISVNTRGNKFKGFESGLVRVSFELHNISKNKKGSVNILQIGNQTFYQSETVADYSGPQIWLEGTLNAGTVKVGDSVTVPTAKAFDILTGSHEVLLTINTPSGVWNGVKNIAAIQEHTFAFTESGYYTIVYVSTDGNGNKTTARYQFYCKDVVSPEVSINGTVKGTAKVGTTMVFPEATYSDNSSECMFSIIVLTPDGCTIRLGSDRSYKFEKTGRYIVAYYATDSDYNYTLIEYQVEVK